MTLPEPAAGPPLARTAVDRAAGYRGDPEWLAAAWQRGQVLLIDPAGRALCTDKSALVLLSAADVPAVSDADRYFLGVDQAGTTYFAVVGELPECPDARPVSLREVGAVLSDRDAGLLTTAAALAHWHASHRYSPVTGAPTTVGAAGWLRLDPGGEQLFPRTDPAVIMLIHDGVAGPAGRCLLGHNVAWRSRTGARRYFSTLAGFVEPGESAEAAVVREVLEEVGVPVSRLRYQGSQAWPYPRSLMLGFTGYADPATPLRIDPSEIADAAWFTRAELAPLLPERDDPTGLAVPESGIVLPGPASIAHYLIRIWLELGHQFVRDATV